MAEKAQTKLNKILAETAANAVVNGVPFVDVAVVVIGLNAPWWGEGVQKTGKVRVVLKEKKTVG